MKAIHNPTRRRLLVAIASTASVLVIPSVSFAQSPAKVWRIGVLHAGAKLPPGRRDQYTTFFETLRELGYVEGKNIAVQWQFAEYKQQRLPELAVQLVNQNVDLIVTNGTPPVRALQQLTTTIPILALSFEDPVGSGFAKSLARPGGNITGINVLSTELGQRRLQMLAEIAPGARRIARLFNPDNPVNVRAPTRLEETARALGRELVYVPVRNESELSAAFDLMIRESVGAIAVAEDALMISLAPRIAELALQRKLPWISSWGERLITEHGLIGYYGDRAQMPRRAAAIAVKIFKGANPADIPIEQPTHFHLVVNLKVAKALGITIPQTILVQATKVIQ